MGCGSRRVVGQIALVGGVESATSRGDAIADTGGFQPLGKRERRIEGFVATRG